jgi:nucleoid-associated protein YgaU
MSRYFRIAVVLGVTILLLACPSAPKPVVKTAEAPTFSPAGGIFTSPQSVTLASATEGAEIRYTTDSSEPTPTSGDLYSAPIQVSTTTTVRAIAYLKGMNDSPISSATYTITGTVSSVRFDPSPDVYTHPVSVTLSTDTDGARIIVTTDGSDPSAKNGTPYEEPIDVRENTTLKAVALKQNWADSAVTSASYTITGKVAEVQFSPDPDVFDHPLSVTLSTSTDEALIYYTTDGTEPSATNGTLYEGPIDIAETTSLMAVAVKEKWEGSAVAAASYTIVEPAAPIVEVPTVEPISDEEVMEARNAIARAKEVDADYYDRNNYDAARRLLDDALGLRLNDPAAAREKLAATKEKADLAFSNSMERAAAEMSARMEAARQRLIELEADKFLPDDFAATTAGIDESKGLFADGDYAGGRARAYQALKEMIDLRTRLETRLAMVKALKKETELSMKEAEEAEAWMYAPAEREKANALYRVGLEEYTGYKLDDAEESFGAAREAARDAVRVAREAKANRLAEEKRKADAKSLEVMKALAEASKLTVVTEDGAVVKPENWKEEDFLKEIERMEQEELQKAGPGGSSLLIPLEEGAVVLADESTENLLKQAKELWTLGIKEKAAGNYEKAQDYFAEALRYIEIYKSYAVKGVYTVRLIPDKRDCLWRIAEYKDIYGNPHLWPKLWRRNRKLIQNPDLIFPGWQLVIPPQ